MMAVKKNVAIKKKKKVWCGLYAPESFNNTFLGETTVYSPEDMVGKSISLALSMITGDMKKQNVVVSFRVKEVKDNKGLTEVLGYSIGPAHIKRMVRRKRDKIDDSFLAKSRDDKLLRIKTVVTTNSKTHDSAISAVRLSLRAKIKKTLKDVDFVDFVNSLINMRLQKDWKSSLSKIYPLKFLEVRYVKLEESKRVVKDEEDKDFTIKDVEETEDEQENNNEETDIEETENNNEETDIEETEDDIETPDKK